jgi:nitrite reductase/ring-hydroxylating ferredoxin subunit
MTDHCSGCERTSRRQFVQDALMFAAGALALDSLTASPALALPVQVISGVIRRGAEVTYPIPPADGATIDRDNQVILVRSQGHLYAFALSCPHQNTALRWEPAENRFQCPKHHSKYQPDGIFISGRATRGMDRYAIHRNGDSVVVDLDSLYRDDRNHDAWLAATIAL